MRRFELVEGSSAKFWQAETKGATFVSEWGRLGTSGQRKEKEFASEEAAQKELQKKINEKLREGYGEVALSSGAQVKSGAKGAEAASKKLELPPRRLIKVMSASMQQKHLAETRSHSTKLLALLGNRKSRSFRITAMLRRLRRSLEFLTGFDFSTDGPLDGQLLEVLSFVTAKNKKGAKLSLRRAFELLYALPATFLDRALSMWEKGASGASCERDIVFLSAQRKTLDDDELTLRAAYLFFDRPDEGVGSTRKGWTTRWRLLKPLLEAALVKNGSNLKTYLKSLEDKGNKRLTRNVSLLSKS